MNTLTGMPEPGPEDPDRDWVNTHRTLSALKLRLFEEIRFLSGRQDRIVSLAVRHLGAEKVAETLGMPLHHVHEVLRRTEKPGEGAQ